MIGRLKEVPPAAWIGAAVLLGALALAYHRYAQDPDDADWTTPAEMQPPPRAPYSCTPCTSASRPMDTGVAFRARAYADDLGSAEFSIIGGIDA